MIQNGVYRLYAIHHGEHPGETKHRLAARFMVDDGNLEILEDHYGHMDDVLPEGPLTEAHRRALAYLLDSGYWSCQHEDARDGGEHPETLAEFQLPPLPEGVPTFRIKGGEFNGQELKVAGDTVIVGGQKLPEAQAHALLQAAEAGEIELELVEPRGVPLEKSEQKKDKKKKGDPLGFLERESRHYQDFKDFSNAYSLGQMRGLYWHITDSPNFVIDPEYAPIEASSMGSGRDQRGLMVTGDLDNWLGVFPKRKYVAQIDLSDLVPNKDYVNSSRGFGHEIFVFSPEKARVVRTVSVDRAKRLQREYERRWPSSERELLDLWNRVRNGGTNV
jgi:hypothetical protein